MLIGELLPEHLHAGILGDLYSQAGGIQIEHRALAGGHVGHALGDIDIVAEQAVAPLGSRVLVQQVVAVPVLQFTNGLAGGPAHHPDAAGLQLVGDALLQVDQLIGGKGGRSRHSSIDLGKALNLAFGTVDQLVLDPLGYGLRHLADDIGHDIELGVVHQGHGHLGQGTGQEAAQGNAGELARGGGQSRELSGIGHGDLLGGLIVAGNGQRAADIIVGGQLVQRRNLLDHLNDLVGDGGGDHGAVITHGHVDSGSGLHIGGDAADIALKGPGLQLLLGGILLLAAGSAALHSLQRGALIRSVQGGVDGANLSQDITVPLLLLLVEGAGFGLTGIDQVLQLSHQLHPALGQFLQVERHNHILLFSL